MEDKKTHTSQTDFNANAGQVKDIELGTMTFKKVMDNNAFLPSDYFPAYRSPDFSNDSANASQIERDKFTERNLSIAIAYYFHRESGRFPVDTFSNPKERSAGYIRLLDEAKHQLEGMRAAGDDLERGGHKVFQSGDKKEFQPHFIAHLVDTLVDQRIEYIKDEDKFGIPDFWNHPNDTVNAGEGDCEDFGLLKRQMMRDLGVPNDRVFLAGGDIKPDSQESASGHAVVILIADDNKAYVLDNDHTGKLIEMDDYKKQKNLELSLLIDDTNVFVNKTYIDGNVAPKHPEKPTPAQKPGL